MYCNQQSAHRSVCKHSCNRKRRTNCTSSWGTMPDSHFLKTQSTGSLKYEWVSSLIYRPCSKTWRDFKNLMPLQFPLRSWEESPDPFQQDVQILDFCWTHQDTLSQDSPPATGRKWVEPWQSSRGWGERRKPPRATDAGCSHLLVVFPAADLPGRGGQGSPEQASFPKSLGCSHRSMTRTPGDRPLPSLIDLSE